MILDNSPSLGWIRVTNAVATYRNKIYIIPDDCTEKKYIYWDSEHPNNFEKTNVIHPQTDNKFLVLINDNGMHTIVHSKTDFFNIAFDSGFQAKVESKIIGLYEETKNSKDVVEKKFSNIVQTIDGISQNVGVISENNIKKFSEINQKIDNVEISVNSTKSDLKINDLRDKVVKEYLSTAELLGHYEIAMQTIMRDEKLDFNKREDFEKIVIAPDNPEGEVVVSVSEQERIKIYNGMIKKQFDKLEKVLLEISENEILKKKKEKELKIIKDNIIPTMKNKINNLIKMINSACLDDIFINTEITSIYTAFQDVLSTLNRDKSTIDKLITLGYGGQIIDTMNKIFLTQENGGFEFSKRINDSLKEISKISLGLNGLNLQVGEFKENVNKKIEYMGSQIDITKEAISSKVSRDDFESEIKQINSNISSKVSYNGLSSTIRQSADEVVVAINKYGEESSYDSSPNFVFNRNGLTVNKGYVAVDTLTVPDGHQPRISLFNSMHKYYDGRPELDATAYKGQGVGESIRLKWNDSNYVYVGTNRVSFFLETGDYSTYTFKNNAFTFRNVTVNPYNFRYIDDLPDLVKKIDNLDSVGVNAYSKSNNHGVKYLRMEFSNGAVALYENGEVWFKGYRLFKIR